MLDNHCFRIVEHFSIGPIRNRWGYTFAVAEVGAVWIFRWESPHGDVYYKYFTDYVAVVKAINHMRINGSGGL
jgi:hypothetical protein